MLDPIIGQTIGQGMGLMLGAINDDRQYAQQGRLSRQQLAIDKQMTDYQNMRQLEMWKKTGVVGQMEQLRKAGLNPGLIYGMSGAGGGTTGGGAASSHGANAPTGGGEAIAMGGMGLQTAMLSAQMKLIEAQTEKTKAEAVKTAGVDTDVATVTKENLILEKVIKDYTGKEAKRMYEDIKRPNSSIEAQAYQQELEAKIGITGTIYELWVEGKLKDKSVAEIEAILLSNAKSRAERMEIMKKMELMEENIKGAKLDNIIKELEKELQTQTGIDKNSPGWLKILGRLFVQMFN